MSLYEGPVCNNCASVGHTASTCPNLPCRYCKRPGHVITDCPEIEPCGICHRKGHPTHKCRNRPLRYAPYARGSSNRATKASAPLTEHQDRTEPKQPQSLPDRDPQKLQNVPVSLVAPGMKSGYQKPNNSEMFNGDASQILVHFPSSLAGVAKELVLSIRDGNHPEISPLGYAAQIQEHGVDALVNVMLNFVHRTVFRLQGRELTPVTLRNLQQDQLEGKSLMQWPAFGGYLDFVTDDRSSSYVRFYVGQSIMVTFRLDTHCRHILQGAYDTLHYFILNKGDGHRSANWLQLWGMPVEMKYAETFSGFTPSLIQCCLEMMFCRAFESLPDQTLADYFGTSPSGQYAGTGLNVLSPLLQFVDLSSLDSSRAQHRSRLSNSSDLEIASWPRVRGQMVAKERQDARSRSITIPPSISAYARLIQEQLQAQGVEHNNLDSVLSKSPLQGGYFHLEYQFTKAFDESDDLHTPPFGSLNAKVCVVLDNRHIDIGTKTSDSGWIPWLLRSVGFHEDNTLLFTYNHTYRGLYDSITSPEDENHIERRRRFTSLLINNSNLRVVLLCGPASRDEMFASLGSGMQAVQGPHMLDFRGQKLPCWLQRLSDNNICRMFVESPEPFPVLLGSDWRKPIKLGEVFKIAVALTDIKVDAYHFENSLFKTRVLKKAHSERSNLDNEPWTPENLDPVVRHHLQRRGFTTIQELEELRKTNSDGSLTRALVVLLHCWMKSSKQNCPRRSDGSRHNKSSGITPSKHQKIEQLEMESVSELYEKAERRRITLQPTEKPLTSMKDVEEIVKECIESETGEGEVVQTDNEERKSVEADILDGIGLEQCGSFNTEDADSTYDSTCQPDIGLLPSPDTIQTLWEYEENLATHQSRIRKVDRVHLSEPASIFSDLFRSESYTAVLLKHGRHYKCTEFANAKGRFLQLFNMKIKLPTGMKNISIRPELAAQGQAHPNRLIRKWLPELEPAARLAIRGWGEREDGSKFDDWIYDPMGEYNYLVTAMRIFKANTIVDWLEDSIDSVSLRPRRYVTSSTSETTSSVKDFAEEHKSKWL